MKTLTITDLLSFDNFIVLSDTKFDCQIDVGLIKEDGYIPTIDWIKYRAVFMCVADSRWNVTDHPTFVREFKYRFEAAVERLAINMASTSLEWAPVSKCEI